MPTFSKTIIEHPNLYISAFIKSREMPCIVFAHGGPGLNCSVLEYLIDHEGIYDSLDFNIVLYDQRGCGRSKVLEQSVLHEDNLDDLQNVCETVLKSNGLTISAIAGHSYGAKLIFDYFQRSESSEAAIFISLAPSILVPRLTNILLDLAYLKTIDEQHYQILLEEFNDLNPNKLWAITEKLAEIFQANKLRPYFYWANLDWKKKVLDIQEQLHLPINYDVFTSVRHDIYSNPDTYCSERKDIANIKQLWINGFHDLSVGVPSNFDDGNPTKQLFFKSAHYPHIEEHERFCDEINIFLKSIFK